VSSGLAVLVLDATAGRFSRMHLPGTRSLTAAAALFGALLAVDAVRVWAGASTSLGLARQTPYEWRLKGLAGVLGWGLDTGLQLSTVRATSLPVVGLVLVAAGHGGPAHGLAYGLGIVAGLLAGLVSGLGDADVRRTMDRLGRQRHRLGPARLVLLPSGLALVAALGLMAWGP